MGASSSPGCSGAASCSAASSCPARGHWTLCKCCPSTALVCLVIVSPHSCAQGLGAACTVLYRPGQGLDGSWMRLCSMLWKAFSSPPLSHLGFWCCLCGCYQAGTRGVAVPWCEASQLCVCTVNLQHCCWQVPELMSHKGKQSMVGAPTPGCQAKGRGGACFLPGHRMDTGSEVCSSCLM